MKIYLDTEFNGADTTLISIGMVSEDGAEFYETVPLPEVVDPWVQKHVVPVIGKDPISYDELQSRLCHFLNEWPEVEIIADYPTDLEVFFRTLVCGPGFTIPVPKVTATLYVRPHRAQFVSKIPHNALADARGLLELAVGATYE